MKYLDHVIRCNSYDLSKFVPFKVDTTTVGWVRRTGTADLLADKSPFQAAENAITFADDFRTPDARSKGIAAVAPAWSSAGIAPELRGEIYPVRQTWADPDLLRIDRALTALLGTRAYGVHLNGFVEKPDGLHLWIGQRSADREVEPDKLDNLVAGGQPAHLSIEENLAKECQEEAGMPAALARQAKPAGTVSYCFETERGLKVDTLFCYDLAVPQSFEPVNQDGEISNFELIPIEEILALIRDGWAFKFNVSLVILDFAIRRGIIRPDDEPDYERILSGLHMPGPGSA